MGGEGKVLDQTARLALGRVRRAEHPPLRRLQRARTAHLVRVRDRVRVRVRVRVRISLSPTATAAASAGRG